MTTAHKQTDTVRKLSDEVCEGRGSLAHLQLILHLLVLVVQLRWCQLRRFLRSLLRRPLPRDLNHNTTTKVNPSASRHAQMEARRRAYRACGGLRLRLLKVAGLDLLLEHLLVLRDLLLLLLALLLLLLRLLLLRLLLVRLLLRGVRLGLRLGLLLSPERQAVRGQSDDTTMR